jgi:hypothetical protein
MSLLFNEKQKQPLNALREIQAHELPISTDRQIDSLGQLVAVPL